MAITITAVLGRDLRTVYFLALDTSANQVPQAVTAVSGSPTVFINGTAVNWTTLAPVTPVTAAPAAPGRGSAVVQASTKGGGLSARADGRRSGGSQRWVGCVSGGIPVWCNNSNMHDCCFVAFLLPALCHAADILTYSAPSGWLTCGSSSAPAATGAAVINSGGKLEPQFGNWAAGYPVAPWNPAVKTMGLGLNVDPQSVVGESFYGAQNLLHRTANPWTGAGVSTPDGFPQTISASNGQCSAAFLAGVATNAVDFRLTPNMPGIYTFTANETNPGAPMTVSLGNTVLSNNGINSTAPVITPLGNSGLVNAGTLQNGVRVGRTWQWNVQYPTQSYPTPTSWDFNLGLTFTTPTGAAGPQTLAQAGMILTGPQRSGIAQVPSQSAPFATDALMVSNMTAANGAGPSCIRAIVATCAEDGSSNVELYPDAVQPGYFSWQLPGYVLNNPNLYGNNISITTVRPYSLTTSPYVYFWDSWGGLASPSGGAVLAPTVPVQRAGRQPVGRRGSSAPGSVRWSLGTADNVPAPYQFAPPAYWFLDWGWGPNLTNANSLVAMEIVTAAPHNLKTGQQVTFSGLPTTISVTNNTGSYQFGGAINGVGVIVWVTGTNTFACVGTSGNANGGGFGNITSTNTGLSGHVNITQSATDSGDNPRAAHAQWVSNWSGTRCWINFPAISTPAHWTAVINEYLANMPSNSTELCLQWGNEMWNNGDEFESPLLSQLGLLFGYNSGGTVSATIGDPFAPQVYRSQQLYNTVAAAVTAAGRTNPVSLVLGTQWGQATVTKVLCQLAVDYNIPIRYLAAAPYAQVGWGYNQNATNSMAQNWPIGSQLDWFRWYMVYGTQSNGQTSNSYVYQSQQQINTYYTLSGPLPVHVGYEGGPQYPLQAIGQSAGTWMDATAHPYAYDMYMAWASACQSSGYAFVNHLGYCIALSSEPYGYAAWGLLHWHGQQAGRGDGSDGKAVNQFCTLQGGSPGDGNCHEGPDGVNPLGNVSPRMQAWLDWQAGANPPAGGGARSNARWFPQLRAPRVQRVA